MVYLITCSDCGLQYVGETGRVFRKILSEHKSGISNTGKTGCKILYNHFRQGCKGYSIKIIEVIKDTLDKEKNKENLLNRENYWIRELRTKYPYGLNDKLYKEDASISVFRQLNKRPREVNRTMVTIPRSKSIKRPNPSKWIMDQHRYFAIDRKSTRLHVIKFIMSADKMWIKELAILIKDRVGCPIDDMIRDLCLARVLNQEPKIKKPKKPKILISHSCKWMGYLNLGKILRNNDVEQKWPIFKDEKFRLPMTIYKYEKKTSSLFFNYRQTIENLDLERWQGNKPDCSCSTSNFKDDFHGHIITGNLNVIPDDDIRRILSMGTGFRIPKKRNRKRCISDMDESLANYIGKILRKDELAEQFIEWKNEIIKIFTENFDNTNDVFVDGSFNISLTMKKKIEKWQDKFVFTCIDKASKNYAVICKRFYIDTLLKETGFNNKGNDTYELVNKETGDIVNKQRKQMLKYGIQVDEDCLKLPFIQITPKMHKSPIGFRTIISSKKCATKILSKNIGKCLKLITTNLNKYCTTISKATHIQPNWIISNNKPITDTISRLGNCNNMKSVATYDFEKLYTNLDIEDIAEALSEVIKIGFGYRSRFIKITNFNAFWSTSKVDQSTISVEELTDMLKFLINNSFFIMGNSVFRQKIGIPMGTDCAPFIANLFLFRYEFNYMMKLLKDKNYKEALKLRYVFRYIDDITIFNDENYLGENYLNIYPNSLNLKKSQYR